MSSFLSLGRIRACQIAASKYFWGTVGTAERETSWRQVLERVVGTITGWANDAGYFEGDCGDRFAADLWDVLVRQEAAFNSPVYFNLGVRIGRNRCLRASSCRWGIRCWRSSIGSRPRGWCSAAGQELA